jgi:hypothetical protein
MAPLFMSPAPCIGETIESNLNIGEKLPRHGATSTHLARPLLLVRKLRLQFLIPLQSGQISVDGG